MKQLESYRTQEGENARQTSRLVCLQAAAVATVFTGLYFYWNIPSLMLMLACCIPLYLISFFALKEEPKLWPRVLLCLTANYSIFISSLTLGLESSVWLYYFPAASCGFLFFTSREKKFRLAIIFLPAALLIYEFLTADMPSIDFIVPLQNFPHMKVVRAFSSLTSFAILISANYLFYLRQLTSSDLLETQRATLIQQEKMSSLGTLASGIAHEINNGLGSLQLNFDVMHEQIKKSEIHNERLEKSSDRIGKIINRMAEIVASLRTYSHGEQQNRDIVSIRQAFNDIFPLLQAKMKNKEIQIQFLPVEGDFFVECNHSHLLQILMNLASNSIDAIENLPEKWIRLEVIALDNSIQMHFVDSGSGIPNEIAQRVFEPFFTTKELGKGTGLGMSLIHGLAKANGGHICYDSYSKNTKFVVTLKSRSII